MPKSFNMGNGEVAPTPAPAPQLSDPAFTSTAPAVMPTQTVMATVTSFSPLVPIAATTQLPAALAKPMTMNEIGKYGDRSANQIASVTDKIAATAKTQDMEEVGKILTSTIMAAKGFDPNNLFKGGLFGFLKAKSAQIQMRYDHVDQTVARLVDQINQRISLFQTRVGDLTTLAAQNEAFYNSLTGEISELKLRADWMEQHAPDVDPNDPMSATKRSEYMQTVTFARKRADDLYRAQQLALAQQAQIGIMATNSSALALKFGDVKTTTIPALKQTFTLYILNLEQKKGAEFADSVDAMTDNAIKANATLLGQNTTAIHTALTRSNISMDALKATHDSVMHSLDEMERIHDEMKTRIAAEAPQIAQMSTDLVARLAQTH